MSNSEEEHEYVVESITEARVKKGRIKTWEYRVRWEGYKEEDDTWEPVESFAGSENLVENFWTRTGKLLGDRDINDLSAFKVGERFFPAGPPLRKKKSQQNIAPVPSSSTLSHHKKRPRASTPPPTASSPPFRQQQPSSKRARQTSDSQPEPSSSRTTKSVAFIADLPRRPPTTSRKEPSVVPPSEEEDDDDEIQIIDPPKALPSSSRQSGSNTAKTSAKSGPSEATVSAHRNRSTNPRVRISDALENSRLSGAIATKARLAGKGKEIESSQPSSSTVRKRKPGPGRSSEGLRAPAKSTSSLLTYSKGQLKSVKGKHVASEKQREDTFVENTQNAPMVLDVQALSQQPQEPPTADELLQLASRGRDIGADLENFEEGNDEHVPAPSPAPEPEFIPAPAPADESRSVFQRSLSLVKESLFPSTRSPAAQEPSVWQRATIFGPLGLGSALQSSEDVNNGTTGARTDMIQTPPFSLILDITSKLPVVLTASSSTDAPILNRVVQNVSAGPPGKFYSNEAALALLDTLRTGGGSAKVIPAPNATESEIRDFEKFRERLSKDELFVFMAGVDLLVFCSSKPSLIAQRLNAPASLLNESAGVLVGRVNIANYSAYADAVVQVGSTVPW
ncbi:hypothetical protein D9757_007701 [Collybiopsis confluens]|uniref:Chromo domain-containing protein n=1 Tax=Collybiopsis confluens TaxID=2823264 RepID=A0A8H5M165_9AGAR|nr:hypothetical protein D9757_007701 [Collybiopsis confluens]